MGNSLQKDLIMKKIIFISNFDTGRGMSGGSRIYFEFLKSWSEYFNIYYFGSLGSINRIRQNKLRNIKYFYTDLDDSGNLNSIFGLLNFTLRRIKFGIITLKNNIQIIKYSDYIYSVSDFYPDFLPAFYAKIKNPRITWIAGYYLFAPSPFSKESPYKGLYWARGLLYWIMQRLSYFIIKKWADFVFITSQQDVKKFITKKRTGRRIIVVQGGVDITESEKYLRSSEVIPVEKRRYDACFVGRLHYQKGVLKLIDIWKKVCELKKDARLVIIGDGPLENIIKKKIQDFGLENNIDLLGFMDGKEKYEIFKQSKIMVHPATYDSGGMAAAEGMAWGLPGVSFDLESLKTYYPKGVIKTIPDDIGQFAKNILELLNNEIFYEKTSVEAHDLIIKVWDWKRRAKNIFDNIS